jgi:hypothetical protein
MQKRSNRQLKDESQANIRTINDIQSEILGKEKRPKHSMKGYTVLSGVAADTHPLVNCPMVEAHRFLPVDRFHRPLTIFLASTRLYGPTYLDPCARTTERS